MRTNLGLKSGNPQTDANRRLTKLENLIQQVPGRPMVVQGGNAVVDTYLVQTAHGFVVGSVIYWTGSAWANAKGNAASTAVWLGVVSRVYGPNAFDITYSGVISLQTALSVTPGDLYYLSSATAGLAVTPADIASIYQSPVFLCEDTTTLIVFPCAAQAAVAGDTVTDKNISQTAHGFSVGQVVYETGSGFALAKANAAATCLYSGVVSKVEDANHFDIVYSGVITGLSGLSAGTQYYLSDATAGALLSTPPASTAYQVPVLMATGSSTAIVYSSSGVGSSHLNLHAGDGTSGGGKLRVYVTATLYVDFSSSGITITNTSTGTSVVITATNMTIANGSGQSSVLDDLGNLTLTQVSGNVIQLLAADIAALSSQTAKMLAYQVCDTGSGTIKTAYILSSPPT